MMLLGVKRFLGLYFVAGVGSGLAHIFSLLHAVSFLFLSFYVQFSMSLLFSLEQLQRTTSNLVCHHLLHILVLFYSFSFTFLYRNDKFALGASGSINSVSYLYFHIVVFIVYLFFYL